MSSPTKPCIIIPHYIATEEIRRLSITTIQSMRATADVFIISVDDGSTLDTKYLDDISDHVIHRKDNKGFAITVNEGLRWALDNGFDYIGVANNDIEVFGGWIEELVYPFAHFERVGITGLISSKEREIYGKPIEKYKVHKITEGGLLSSANGMTWIQSGGLLLSTADIWNEIGLYDESFEYAGEEDVDLFLRCENDFNYKIVMSGLSCFWHKEGATRWNEEIGKDYAENNHAIEERNYDTFTKKWGWDIRTEGLHFYEDLLEEK